MKNDIYRHFKGNEYEVVSECIESKTGEKYILYRPLYNDSGFWIRPYDMFFEKVEFNGEIVDRFSLTGSSDKENDLDEFVASHSETLAKYVVKKVDNKLIF